MESNCSSEEAMTESTAAGVVTWRDGVPVFRGIYSHLSRGKHHAKHMESGEWARRPVDSVEDVLVLNKPGKWMLHSNDGFRRRRTDYIIINLDNP